MRLATFLCVALSSTTALAHSAPRTHDGFHLSLGLGFGYSSTSAGFDPEPSGAPDLSIAGPGIGGMLLVGGTLAPGLVLGGGTMGGHFFTPTVTIGSEENDSDSDLIANVLGPYVDYYLDPAQGLHFLGLLGFATMEDGDDDSGDVALGFGAVLGAGWDFFVADEWSVGVLARCHLLMTGTTAETAAGDLDVSYTTVIPALLATVAYH